MAKKENDATYILDSKKGLPNKLLQADGTTTDMLGNVVVNPDTAWDSKPALPNKWLNPDGTYSTLNEIIAGMVDTSIYVIVDELPSEGNPQKIYLVPDGKGGFVEYHWTGSKWDPIGTIDIDLSNYSTTQEMMNAIEAAGILTLNSAKTYTDEQIAGISANPQVFYWDGNTQQAGLDFWNNIYQLQKTQPCLVYTRYTQNSKSITQHWLYNNNMPTSASETTVSYSVYTPSGMQMIDNSYSQISRYTCQLYFTITNDQVTAISMNTQSPSSINYIDATGYYPTAFMPSSPSSPTTKKYVDDKINETSVFLSHFTIDDLTEESTMEEIYEAFGGEDFFKDMVFNKFANKASLYFYDNFNEERGEEGTNYEMYLTLAQYEVSSTSGYTFDIIIRSLVNRKPDREH